MLEEVGTPERRSEGRPTALQHLHLLSLERMSASKGGSRSGDTIKNSKQGTRWVYSNSLTNRSNWKRIKLGGAGGVSSLHCPTEDIHQSSETENTFLTLSSKEIWCKP